MSPKRRNNSVEHEQFFTKPEIAERLIKLIRDKIRIDSIVRFIEPSAGTGSFSDLFPGCGAYDLFPQKEGIIKADFLKHPINTVPSETLIFGNPPFGRQGTLALSFLKKSMNLADYVAFILPASFGKISVQNRIPATHHLKYQERLEDDSFFSISGATLRVGCVFQIWTKGDEKRIILPKKSLHLKQTTKNECDFAFRRVGGTAGTIVIDRTGIKNTCEASHYYFKTIGDAPQKVLEILRNVDWKKYTDFSTGPKSISAAEIFAELETISNENRYFKY